MPLVSRCNNIGSFGTNRQRSGHVHERALTSASFRNLDRCRYTELARPNNTQHIEDSPLYQVVRHGIGKHDVTFTDRSLGFYQKALRQFVREDPNPKRYRSTC